ncbi:hypothetical protein J4731_10615 [Providencia rettgeri]|nr:hypothetical protein [Providencia rettgeri]
MKIDKTISWPIAILWGSLFLIPLFNTIPLDFNIDLTTKIIEHFQSVTLIISAIFTWFYMKPLQQKSGNEIILGVGNYLVGNIIWQRNKLGA